MLGTDGAGLQGNPLMYVSYSPSGFCGCPSGASSPPNNMDSLIGGAVPVLCFLSMYHPPLFGCSETRRHGARTCFSLRTYLISKTLDLHLVYEVVLIGGSVPDHLSACVHLIQDMRPLRSSRYIYILHLSNAVRTVSIHPTIHPSYVTWLRLEPFFFFLSGSWPVKYSQSQG